MTNKKINIFILAGEPSGDLHGAKLIKELKTLNPEINIFGIGGNEMKKEGLNSIVDIKKISVVGFWEVSKKYIFFKKLLKECQQFLLDNNIDVFIPIDYPGFNIPLAKFAKKHNIFVAYYIAPQFWAWAQFRAKKFKNAVNKLFVILPFEESFFKNYGIDALYVGNPNLNFFQTNEQTKVNNFNERQDKISIFPGSRNQEIKRNLEFIKDLLLQLVKELPNYQIAISVSNNIDVKIVENYIKTYFNLNSNIILHYDSKELMKISKFGLIKTGTTNLEACLNGLPFIMFYKASKINYLIGKNLLNINSVSLVNIIYEKTNNLTNNNDKIITEYIQDLDVEKIITEIKGNIENVNKFNSFQSKLLEVKSILGNFDTSKIVANNILNYKNLND